MSTYHEEKRADRVLEAQLKRDAATTVSQARMAEKRLDGEQRRLDRIADRDQDRRDRLQKQQEREKRVAAVTGWFRDHWLDVMFVPVIVVPAIMAWTAMAAFGGHVFGPVGWGLPVFSEGAMWIFAAATTTIRGRNAAAAARPAAAATRHIDAPVWHLQLGTAVFAVVAAVLNLLHGLSAPGGGLTDAVVMALVSIGGVLVHQLVSAGPRRTRAERADASIARQVARRELAVRRAAARTAVAELDEQGQARLLYRAGVVTLQRRLVGRARLVEAIVPARSVPVTTDGEDLAAEIDRFLTGPEAAALLDPGTGSHPAGTAETSPAEPGQDDAEDLGGNAGNDQRFAELLAEARAVIAAGELPARPSRRQLRRALRCRQDMAGEVHKALLADQDDDEDDGDGLRVAA
jgi:hypothetical protein